MWVVLSDPSKKDAWTDAEFFASGRDEVEQLFARFLPKYGIQPSGKVALDFGCGLGRLTQALARRFELVYGIDISPRMIEGAQARNQSGERARFFANATPALPMIPSKSVDFIYSRISLQHIPRPTMRSYIREFGRVLAPGGVAVFQTLTRPRSAIVRVRHAIRTLAPGPYFWLRGLISSKPRWEMNTIPERLVRQSLSENGVRVVAVEEDQSAGSDFDSKIFVALR